MSGPLDDEEEPPLDPVLARVQARLRRLMLIGGGTLAIGIVAVLFAIIYRFFIADSPLNRPAENPSQPFVVNEVTAEAVGLPPGAELVSTTLNGNQMALGFRDGADTVMVLIDTTTMTVTGQLRIAGGGGTPGP